MEQRAPRPRTVQNHVYLEASGSRYRQAGRPYIQQHSVGRAFYRFPRNWVPFSPFVSRPKNQHTSLSRRSKRAKLYTSFFLFFSGRGKKTSAWLELHLQLQQHTNNNNLKPRHPFFFCKPPITRQSVSVTSPTAGWSGLRTLGHGRGSNPNRLHSEERALPFWFLASLAGFEAIKHGKHLFSLGRLGPLRLHVYCIEAGTGRCRMAQQVGQASAGRVKRRRQCCVLCVWRLRTFDAALALGLGWTLLGWLAGWLPLLSSMRAPGISSPMF